VTLGRAPTQDDAFRTTRSFCEQRLSATSVYRLLHDEAHRLFADEHFADLFTARGRDSVPPRIVAVVMVLQRIEGLSDREAVERFEFDARWKYAAGGLDYEHPGFVHTVLVDMRARLRRSARPDRIFEAVLDVAKSAGLVGRKRVLDSTALYDAVATQDTVTMIRASIRALLRVADDALAAELRTVLRRDDDYASAGKPACAWDDQAAREALVDSLAHDAHAVLSVLHARSLASDVKDAAKLVATVVGQDLEEGHDGVFRIAHRVAPDRVISTVDPEARHGHKTAARGFDGYKGHIAIDPDSEIITSTAVTAANASDGSVAKELLADVIATASQTDETPTTQPSLAEQATAGAASAEHVSSGPTATEPDSEITTNKVVTAASDSDASAAKERVADVAPAMSSAIDTASAQARDAEHSTNSVAPDSVEVYGDASYGTGEILQHLEDRAIAHVKVQPPSAPAGCFSKEAFEIDLEHNTVRCPAGVLVQIRALKSGPVAEFGPHCATCPLRDQCTKSKSGRLVRLHEHERLLQRERKRQKDPAWRAHYKATRPKVERKQAHMMRRRHGGRRARMRGRTRIGHDFSLLAAATNLQRLAVLMPRRAVA
jgi:hypothetical protein